jgi:hypothetical protein
VHPVLVLTKALQTQELFGLTEDSAIFIFSAAQSS